MTLEFFNMRLLFEPQLLAVDFAGYRRIMIVYCQPKIGKYEVVRDFHWAAFRSFTLAETIDHLRGYSSFLGVKNSTSDQGSLLAQLDSIMKEHKCQTHSDSTQVTTASVKSKEKSDSSSTSLKSKKSKTNQTKGS